MPALDNSKHKLMPRYYYNGDWAGGARWAFFVIVIVGLMISVAAVIRANKLRSRRGMQPIYGTRWITPPSYYQSQGQYNQPTRTDPDIPNAYVPTYSETANADDMGYYAADGTFHQNPNAKGPAFPESAHQRTTSNADGQPIQNLDNMGATVADEEDHDFTRPSGSPPGSSGVTRHHTSSYAGEYERPDHPPPGR